jgi:hypothetical protein
VSLVVCLLFFSPVLVPPSSLTYCSVLPRTRVPRGTFSFFFLRSPFPSLLPPPSSLLPPFSPFSYFLPPSLLPLLTLLGDLGGHTSCPSPFPKMGFGNDGSGSRNRRLEAHGGPKFYFV